MQHPTQTSIYIAKWTKRSLLTSLEPIHLAREIYESIKNLLPEMPQEHSGDCEENQANPKWRSNPPPTPGNHADELQNEKDNEENGGKKSHLRLSFI